MFKAGRSGVTTDTPKTIQFGAGTIHKGLAFTPYSYVLTSDTEVDTSKTYYTRSGSEPYTYTKVTTPVKSSLSTYYEYVGGWNFAASCIGATQGGSKISIVPEFVDIEADGAWVLVKGLKVKTGEAASMEINLLELTKSILKDSLIAYEGASDADGWDLIETKADLAVGDYYTNIAFVGRDLEGKNIIVIMDNALCTSGFEMEGKNKEAGVGKYTFTCHAALDGDLEVLPIHIYYPEAQS